MTKCLVSDRLQLPNIMAGVAIVVVVALETNIFSLPDLRASTGLGLISFFVAWYFSPELGRIGRDGLFQSLKATNAIICCIALFSAVGFALLWGIDEGKWEALWIIPISFPLIGLFAIVLAYLIVIANWYLSIPAVLLVHLGVRWLRKRRFSEN